MKEEKAPTDDGTLAAQESSLRSSLCRGQRLPTIAEVRALQKRFDLTLVQSDLVRSEIVQAATFYFAHENPQTANKQSAHYANVIKKTGALLELLGDRVAVEMINVEPPGIRKMLFQMHENAKRQLAVIRPHVDPNKKQRRKTRTGLENTIRHLAHMLNWFDRRPRSIYTQDPSNSKYSGEFFELAESVCSLCGIPLASQTIGDAIKTLNREGMLFSKAKPRRS